MIKTGDRFPIETLRNGQVPLAYDKSAYTVFYFYPMDDTPGCTIEANEFQKLKGEFDAAGIRILGVSVDDAASHQAFCEKFGLAFELATDPGGALGKELGILKGDKHRRVTYVADSQGKLVLQYAEVKPAEHARQILTDIAQLRK